MPRAKLTNTAKRPARITNQVLRQAARLKTVAGAALLGFVCQLFSTSTCADQKSSNEPHAPKIAIVIDDLGYTLESGRLLSQLPYPLTLAVIPGTPHGKEIAKLAQDAKQELILHVPMQPKDRSTWENGLSIYQTHENFSKELQYMLDQYPHISGVNNHGGSLLTADLERMNWVMAVLKPRQLYFLDSRTTSESQAIVAAEAHSVESISRDVFLDNVRDEHEVTLAFERLRDVARKHGQAIAIGHPHKVTIEQLLYQLPMLIDEGFELSYCSDLLKK